MSCTMQLYALNLFITLVYTVTCMNLGKEQDEESYYQCNGSSYFKADKEIS